MVCKNTKDLVAKVRNTHGYENLEEILGFGLGDMLYKIVDLAEEPILETKSIFDAPLIKCSKCGQTVHKSHKFCCNCGIKF